MTCAEYIAHLETMRRMVLDILNLDIRVLETKGKFLKANHLEQDRNKKTIKMMEDLAIRLYEDGAISRRIRDEKIESGELEQGEMDFGGGK